MKNWFSWLWETLIVKPLKRLFGEKRDYTEFASPPSIYYGFYATVSIHFNLSYLFPVVDRLKENLHFSNPWFRLNTLLLASEVNFKTPPEGSNSKLFLVTLWSAKIKVPPSKIPVRERINNLFVLVNPAYQYRSGKIQCTKPIKTLKPKTVDLGINLSSQTKIKLNFVKTVKEFLNTPYERVKWSAWEEITKFPSCEITKFPSCKLNPKN